jgi:hypothetical protein
MRPKAEALGYLEARTTATATAHFLIQNQGLAWMEHAIALMWRLVTGWRVENPGLRSETWGTRNCNFTRAL